MNEYNQCFCPNCGSKLSLVVDTPKANQKIREIPLHTRKGTSRLGFRHIWCDEDEAEPEENESLEDNAGIPFVSQLKQTARAFYGHKAVRSEIRYFSNGASKADPTIKSHTYERKPQYKIDLLYEWCLPIGMGAAVSAFVTMFLYLLNVSLTPVQGLVASFGSWIFVSVIAYREIQKRVTGERVVTEYHEPKPQPDIIQKIDIEEHVAKLEVKESNHSYQWFDMTFPVPKNKMKRIARHLENGGSFSRTSIADKSRIISGYKFRQLVETLQGRDMAYVEDNKTHLKAIGKKLFKSYLEAENIPVQVGR